MASALHINGTSRPLIARSLRNLLAASPAVLASGMASAASSLYRPQPAAEVNKLVRTLDGASGKKKRDSFACRKATYSVEGTDLSVDSWKFNDWDYKKRDAALPTNARGLFTVRNPKTGNYEIAIRGYDKFFNIDEIYRTRWDWIQENTKPPYEVTVKENGCIIFISGLPDDTLLVCSKHATGPRSDVPISHACAGEKWIDRQLASLTPPRTRADLARALRAANATAVAELCDDSFEEHILAYEGDQAGMYLHGINLNLPDFTTYPMEEVYRFADEWGFKKIDYMLKNDVPSLREFLEGAAETGSWDGKDVEGFVIRSKARNGPNDPEWHDWFFKYKFDEPYLMYRQWRECTKAMISGKQPKMRKHQKITKEYLQFAKSYFVQNRGASEQYQLNHGIIKLRNAFLESRGLKGSDIIKEQEENEPEVDRNIVLVPVATIGCGKTTVALGLVKLFQWGHEQNDNITARKGKPQMFANACIFSLAKHPVVIADRNNHQKRERQQLINDVSRSVPGARFIALHFVHHDGHDEEIRKATRDRVFNRGDNHQTIQAGSKSQSEILGIMEGFMKRFEPVDPDNSIDSGFDAVIDLDPRADSRTNLETVVQQLHSIYPKLIPELPSPEDYDNAINAALNEYQPDIKHTIKGGNQNKKARVQKTQAQTPSSSGGKPVEYFSISLPAESVRSALEQTFGESSVNKDFFEQLRTKDRIQKEFHVTLLHCANIKQFPDLWKKYNDLLTSNPEGALGSAEVKLEKVVWDDRVMAIVANIVTDGIQCSNEIAHVTVGTRNKQIRPKEANDMLQKWNKGEPGKNECLLGPDGSGLVLKGEVKAVLSTR